MALTMHDERAEREERHTPRMWQFLSAIANWSWERSLGVEVDQDGGVEGNGVLVRIETPRWIRLHLWRWIAHITPEWMKERHRADISDVVMQSLLPRVTLGAFLGGIDIASGAQIHWQEDRLNGP